MQELNRKMREYKVRPAALLLSLTLFVFSCKKKQEYVYDVNDETISAAGVQKPNVKSNTEFISIAHTDVMGTTVSAGNLNELKTQYLAFGRFNH
jgi:PBP1b-binding outer membrane lipoprotein LpoB